jgi:hypothetical protein
MPTENHLKIGNHEAIVVSLVPRKKEYDNVNSKGEPLTYVPGKVERGYYVDESGAKVTDTCKMIGGKPLGKLNKTKEVKPEKIETVPISNVDNLIVEKQYLVDCDAILQELNEEKSGQAYSFKYTTGNGFAVYRALLYPSKIFKDYLVMVLGTTRISDIITDLEEVRAQKEKLKSVSLTLQEIIPQATVDDIEVDI